MIAKTTEPPAPHRRPRRAAVAAILSLLLAETPSWGFPVKGDQTLLPNGTDFGEDAPQQPRQIFHSEVLGGRRSYLVDLGDMAFSAPAILGGLARRAGISCETCHVNGASNPRLVVPLLSTRPGNFDTTGAIFNAKADNGVLDPTTVPSLRGARYLAPYGHDGRMQSLRDFVRNVIVNEFAGPEPSPAILDGLVAYIQDIDFLPNPKLAPDGHLATNAGDAERRGETLFDKPFPHDPALSCAACHVASSAFVDHLQHDVGSGGLFKTPTLLNADFNAPYFHDGRYDTYAEVIGHFDRLYRLGFSKQDSDDLVAYLTAIGDGEEPYDPVGLTMQLDEIRHFLGVLNTALRAHDGEVITLAVDTVDRELRDLTEEFPDHKDTAVRDGLAERNKARNALAALVLQLRRIGMAAAAEQYDEAAADFSELSSGFAAALPVLQAAVPWSLFNPTLREAHYAALRQLQLTATRASN